MANGKTDKITKRPPVLPAPRAKVASSSHPEITVGEGPLGRNTLADVKDDLRRAPGPRAPMMTVSYNDLPLDAKRVAAAAAVDPGPVIEVRENTAESLWKAVEAGPAIELGEAPLGRETLAMIEAEARGEAPPSEPAPPPETNLGQTLPHFSANAAAPPADSPRPPPPRTPAPRARKTPLAPRPEPTAATCEALELKSFIVPATALSPKASDEARRNFVRDRLANHLPCDIDRVKRIDARLFEPGAVLVRVFCPVD